MLCDAAPHPPHLWKLKHKAVSSVSALVSPVKTGQLEVRDSRDFYAIKTQRVSLWHERAGVKSMLISHLHNAAPH